MSSISAIMLAFIKEQAKNEQRRTDSKGKEE